MHLKEEFPFTMVFKNELISFLKSSGILMLLFYVIGFFNKEQSLLYYFSGFFLTLFVTFIFNYLLNSKIISAFVSDGKWNLWKEITRRLFFLIIYIFNAIVYIDYSLNINFSKVDFSQFLTISFIIGSIPIVIRIVMTKNKLLKSSLIKAELLHKKIRLHQLENTPSKEELVIKSNIINEVFKIDLNDLLYIQSNQNYISIYYLNDHRIKSHLLRISLVNALKQITSENIIQCHRSYLVHLNSIEKITGNAQGLKLQLPQNIVVPVSRSFVKEFKATLVD
ncbi:MAG: LytTR family transcriptional regulator [Flavobacteriaceae bacterium]|nr:LytTR family transcriptional regulator [Flavobacteriaceae bacterium]